MPEGGIAVRVRALLAGPPSLSDLSAGIAVLACAAVAATLASPPQVPTLIWNASRSMPPGLYAVEPGARIVRGDVVAARLPPEAGELAASRGYLPRGLPIIKRAAGVPGDRICSVGSRVTVNGIVAAVGLDADAEGRPLPSWQGCECLGRGSYFLLGIDGRSFDGRYFGVSGPSGHVMKARLLWRR